MKLLLILGMVAALAGPVEVTSPSGDLKVSLENPSGQVVYSVSYKGEAVIGKSSLGLVTRKPCNCTRTSCPMPTALACR